MAESGHRALRYPRILGHEVVGRVLETDAGSQAPWQGRLVQVWPGVPCGHCQLCLKGADNMCSSMGILGYSQDGGFAQRMAVSGEAVRSGAVNLVPDSVSAEEASLTEPLACCLQALERSGLKANDTLLIFGGGPMGLMAAMGAESQGMEAKVLETDARRRRLGKALGLQVLDALEEQELAIGGAADGILLCTPQVPVSSALIPFLAPRGRICVFSGMPPSLSQGSFDWNALHYRELTICGSYGSTSKNNRKAFELITSGQVPAMGLITHRIALSEISRGLELTSKHEGLKCVINDFR